MREKILLVMSILLCINALIAVPFGTLGNIDVPDGFVMPANQISINFASYLRDSQTLMNNAPGEYEYNYVVQAKYGLFDRAELGFVYTGDDVFYTNFKWQLYQESLEFPGITIGVDNLFSKVGTDATDREDEDFADWEDIPQPTTYEKNSFYLAISKSWAVRDFRVLGDMQIYLTGGIGINRFLGQRDVAQDFNGLFGTIEYYPTSLFPKNNFSIFAEQSGHAINFGAKYTWNSFAFQYSVIEIEEFIKENQDNLKMAFNVQYNLTRWASEKTTKQGTFEPNQERLRTQRQTFDTATAPGTNSSILDQIRAATEEREKANSDLNDLLQELEDLE